MIRRVALAARFWYSHYGPQDVAAALAAVLGAFVLARFAVRAPVIAAVCACLEWIVFYGVAFERNRRGLDETAAVTHRTLLASLVREYGVAEGIDLFLRPGLMHMGLLALPGPWLGVLVGGLGADAVFYFIAALASGRLSGSPSRPSSS